MFKAIFVTGALGGYLIGGYALYDCHSFRTNLMVYKHQFRNGIVGSYSFYGKCYYDGDFAYCADNRDTETPGIPEQK